jgi:hypothetical protein
MGQQIGFPEPENKNEWLQSDGTVTASWTAPPDVPDATYDVYLGTSPEELSSVATGLAETSTILDGMSGSLYRVRNL